MVKYVNLNVFLTALLILVIIIIAAFFAITTYENYKKANYEEDIKFLNQQMLMNDLFLSYIQDTNNSESKCAVLEKQYAAEYNINRQLLNKLRQINKNALVPTSNYIKHMYVLTNVKLWLYHKKLNIDCNKDKILVLYFYSENLTDNKVSRIRDDQLNSIFENTLTDLSKRCDKINIFALPYNKDIIILDQIITDYNIGRYPAVVVENKVYYDLTQIKDYNCE